MAGFDLNEGEYEKRVLTNDEMWSTFCTAFSSKSHNDSSYKYGFLKAIIDNLYNADNQLKLTFDQLFGKFTEIYWNLILKYGLRQKATTSDNRKTYLEQILLSTKEKYRIYESIPYENLTPNMMMDIEHQVKMKCKKYVVGALYEDMNKRMYSFSKTGEWIQINPQMYEFICKHKLIIEKLNYYEWAKFLEKVNDTNITSQLLNKIDGSSKRSNLSIYREILFEEFENRCFYCGKKLDIKNADVDHFIPWSFIKDDNLWNMVLACPSCNRKKNDRLPDIIYLDRILERNDEILIKHQDINLENYHRRTLQYIYKWAQLNGYEKTWKPKLYKD